MKRRVFCFLQKIIGDKKFKLINQLIKIRQKEERREVNNITGLGGILFKRRNNCKLINNKETKIEREKDS